MNGEMKPVILERNAFIFLRTKRISIKYRFRKRNIQHNDNELVELFCRALLRVNDSPEPKNYHIVRIDNDSFYLKKFFTVHTNLLNSGLGMK